MKHINNVTQAIVAFREKAPERFADKLRRTVACLLLFAIGLGLLHIEGRLALAEEAKTWYNRFAVAAVGLGLLGASMDFIRIPIDYGLAVAREIYDLIKGKATT